MVSSEAGEWFLRRVMGKITAKYGRRIWGERLIWKAHLYKDLSCWFRFRREESKAVLDMLARAYDGVRFSNRGLYIPPKYLDRTKHP